MSCFGINRGRKSRAPLANPGSRGKWPLEWCMVWYDTTIYNTIHHIVTLVCHQSLLRPSVPLHHWLCSKLYSFCYPYFILPVSSFLPTYPSRCTPPFFFSFYPFLLPLSFRAPCFSACMLCINGRAPHINTKLALVFGSWPSVGSRPSDHYFLSVSLFVCLSVCLSVCLCIVFLSRLWSDFDQTRTHVIYVWV